MRSWNIPNPKSFLEKHWSLWLCCEDDSFSLKDFYDEVFQAKEHLLYIDLALCKDGDYGQALLSLAQGTDKVLLDHIDQLPAINDRGYWEYLVKMALKRDTLPLYSSSKLMVDFNDLCVVARCCRKPQYMEGQSVLAYLLCIKNDIV